ncbi:MAG: FAD-binding oxidoreductase, partial [Acetobacteraceae bacterium]|nr:FAD-binding oxidoreductase [Acetobacteraceae bacterium]
EAGAAVVPRGAGLSYTGGVVPREPAVVIDTAALTRIEIRAEDLTGIVGAGCSWEALAAALEPHGLRPAATPPISGSHSTVGGAASQGVAGSEGIIGLAVVLADGSLVRTGTWTTPGRVPFWRHYGPDLTGLFLGDCGAFGIKTEIALRLLPAGTKRFASFGFTHGREVAAAIARLQRGPGGKAIAFDRARATSATKGMEIGEAVRTVAAVAGRAGSLTRAVKDVIGMRRARDELEEAPWSLHVTAEGCSAAHADAQLEAMREICVAAGGAEIPPAVPQALAARPFSVRGMVGQDGERWVPVHGYLPLSAAPACLDAVETLFCEREAEIRHHGVRINWLLGANNAAVTMEPMFYWRDALDPLHLRHLSDRNRARFGGFAPNLPARDFVRELRADTRDVMDRHGATHNQIGRFYRPPRGDLLGRIKTLLDPQLRMNPGVLGL